MIYGRRVISLDGNKSSLWSLTLRWCEGGHYGMNQSCSYKDSCSFSTSCLFFFFLNFFFYFCFLIVKGHHFFVHLVFLSHYSSFSCLYVFWVHVFIPFYHSSSSSFFLFNFFFHFFHPLRPYIPIRVASSSF